MVSAKVGTDLVIYSASVATGILPPIADEDVRHNAPILAEMTFANRRRERGLSDILVAENGVRYRLELYSHDVGSPANSLAKLFVPMLWTPENQYPAFRGWCNWIE